MSGGDAGISGGGIRCGGDRGGVRGGGSGEVGGVTMYPSESPAERVYSEWYDWYELAGDAGCMVLAGDAGTPARFAVSMLSMAAAAALES